MFRTLCALLLALSLAATSVSAAVMHAEMQGAQQMVICSDTDASPGLTTITLDANGKPITSPHRCPDCTAAAAALLPDAAQSAPHSAASAPRHLPPAPDRANRATPPQTARDPPAFA